MKKKLKRNFHLKRETLRNLTPEMSRKAAGGTVYDWTESPFNISCQQPTACGTGTATQTDPGCGPSCELVPC